MRTNLNFALGISAVAFGADVLFIILCGINRLFQFAVLFQFLDRAAEDGRGMLEGRGKVENKLFLAVDFGNHTSCGNLLLGDRVVDLVEGEGLK